MLFCENTTLLEWSHMINNINNTSGLLLNAHYELCCTTMRTTAPAVHLPECETDYYLAM